MKRLVNILFPESCIVCGERLNAFERHICICCLSEMPLTYFWNWHENPAEKTLWARINPERVISLYYYSNNNPYSDLIHKIKYNGNRQLGLWLGNMLGLKILENDPVYLNDIDYLIPVPLHPLRRIKRGFNQAEVIAKGISSSTGKRLLKRVLIRKRHNTSQTGTEVKDKWKNVAGAFALKRSADHYKDLEGAHIALIDDVLTTGSTIEACSQMLKGIKNLRVSIITLAFVG